MEELLKSFHLNAHAMNFLKNLFFRCGLVVLSQI